MNQLILNLINNKSDLSKVKFIYLERKETRENKTFWMLCNLIYAVTNSNIYFLKGDSTIDSTI